ncbi:hypothetical protein C2S51_007065 [Perilla frutescens var. frutescens]|nr:hypothetical protein C2S51_007065 [Perilla frutescens var. frutescens]
MLTSGDTASLLHKISHIYIDQRGSVAGRLYAQDRCISEEKIAAKGAYVGLAAPGKDGSFQKEAKGYQFWVNTDEDGYFNITNVHPGDYNIYTWIPGFIGDYRCDKAIVVIVGIPDRSAAEFYVPDPNPSWIGVTSLSPNFDCNNDTFLSPVNGVRQAVVDVGSAVGSGVEKRVEEKTISVSVPSLVETDIIPSLIPSLFRSFLVMSWQRVVVIHSGRWERLDYLDGEDALVHLLFNQLSYDGLIQEIHDFMETSPTNVTYTLNYLTGAGPSVEGLSVNRWLIPVGHIDDDSPIVHDDPSELDSETLVVGKTFLKKDDLSIAVGNWHVICKRKRTGCGECRNSKIIIRVSSTLNNAPRKMSSKVVADYFAKKIRYESAVLKPRAIIAELLREHGIEIEYGVALRARNLAIEMVYGSHDRSFEMLPAYLHKLRTNNPGTVCEVQMTNYHRFKFMFVALGVCISVFRQCLRPVVIIDGTHLKGKSKGVLFVAVTKDKNEKCFPLVVGVGPVENDQAWTWFLERFRMGFRTRDDLVIVSDQHQSIKNVVARVYPDAHIAKNHARHGKHLISMFKVAAYAYRHETFLKYMSMIANNETVYRSLLSIGVDHWARSQSSVRRYGFMTSNMAESFNARLLWARRFPICSLIEVVRSVIERWFDQRRELAVSRDHMITEEAYRKLSKQVEKGRHFVVHQTTAYLHKVVDGDRSFVVDLQHHTCDCAEFQLDQMSCSHATAAMRSIRVLHIMIVCLLCRTMTNGLCHSSKHLSRSFLLYRFPKQDDQKNTDIVHQLKVQARRPEGNKYVQDVVVLDITSQNVHSHQPFDPLNQIQRKNNIKREDVGFAEI